MQQKFIATLSCLIFSCVLHAQTGWLPPVTFPANTSVCDFSPLKLVFYDDFNGTTLSDKWTTAVIYDSDRVVRKGGSDTVIKGEHPDHPGARYNGSDGPTIYLEDNIVVSNGTCKLLMNYAPNSTWTVRDSQRADYPLVTQHADLTGAIIRLPHENINRDPTGYSSGRFEARIKHPIFTGSWTSFWMWPGRGRSIDELDVTESRGGESVFNRHTVDYAMHAWWNEGYNPYSLPGEVGITRKWLNQEWHKWIFGGYFKMQNWHTYVYEWDTSSITAIVDGIFNGCVWKYGKIAYYYGPRRSQTGGGGGTYYAILEGSGCNVDGQYNITHGYPWNSTDANVDVRFECKFKDGAADGYSLYGSSPRLMGAMEIDYVKIWQKHPENDNHTELCAANTYPATPTISGPNEVCGQVAYTLSPATTGTWSTFNSDILDVGTTTSSGADVAKDAGPAFNLGWVAFSYSNGVEGCPSKTVYKYGLYCNESTDWDVMVPYVYNNNGEGRFHLMSGLYHRRDVSGNTTPVVTWDISINYGSDSYDEHSAENYTLEGQYATTASVAMLPNESYNLRWKMNVTDASGTWSRSGERNSKTALLQQEDDRNTYYLNAYIDDQDRYDTIVYNAVAESMVSEEEYNDTLFMDEMIEEIRAEALEPYIITDGLESLINQSSSLSKPDDEDNVTSVFKSKLKVYPNPVGSDITIIAGSDFNDREAINLSIYDLLGRCIYTGILQYKKGDIMKADLSKIQAGNYILELKQGYKEEHVKITKAD
jgi:hypothetical protein